MTSSTAAATTELLRAKMDGGAAARASSGGVGDDGVATSVLDAAAQETSLDVRQAASFEVVEHALLVRVGEGVGVAEEVRLGGVAEKTCTKESTCAFFVLLRAVNLGVFLGRARAEALSWTRWTCSRRRSSDGGAPTRAGTRFERWGTCRPCTGIWIWKS